MLLNSPLKPARTQTDKNRTDSTNHNIIIVHSCFPRISSHLIPLLSSPRSSPRSSTRVSLLLVPSSFVFLSHLTNCPPLWFCVTYQVWTWEQKVSTLWHSKQIWVKGANWRVIHLLNCFFTKPHCYGVFTYTVIEDNFYDSVFLMFSE